jgi:allantoate deiminase
MTLNSVTTLPAFDRADKQAIGESARAMVEQIRRHGAGPDGGVTRLTYSPEWVATMAEIEQWFLDRGLEVKVDAVGSRFGRLEGANSEVVMSGSHVDSVRNGGAYDGVLGVVMSTIAVGWLGERCGHPVHALEVFANCEEESSRFPGNFWGTRAMLGLITPGETDDLRDLDGTTIGTAMRGVGLDPDRIPEAKRSDLAAFVETHVEQGTRLEAARRSLGVVERVVGVRQMGFTFAGTSGHAGTIPMQDRRDPLVAAAEFVMLVKQAAVETGEGAVATVGSVKVAPGGTNQIAEEVRLSVDFRHADDPTLDGLEQIFRESARLVSARNSVSVAEELWLSQQPIDFDENVRAAIERSCEAAGCSWMHIASGAGHDAQVIAREVPAGMLFVPSRGGHSHRPDEETEVDDIVAGTEVLIRTLHRLAYVR